MTIKDYTVIKATNLEALIQMVKEAIDKGWIPQGGICEAGTENFLFFQAMIYKTES